MTTNLNSAEEVALALKPPPLPPEYVAHSFVSTPASQQLVGAIVSSSLDAATTISPNSSSSSNVMMTVMLMKEPTAGETSPPASGWQLVIDVNVVLTIVYLAIFFIGVIGNICNCLVIADSRNRYMKTATNYYLFSLSISDLLLLIFGLPHDLVILWHPSPYLFGEFVCISRGWISETSTYASVLVIVAFTVERYLAICHPLKAHTLSRLSRSVKIIVLIWLVASTCALVVVMQYGIVIASEKQPDGSDLLIGAQCTTVKKSETIFELSVLIFFIIPMAVITILYVKLGCILRAKTSLIKKSRTKKKLRLDEHLRTAAATASCGAIESANHRPAASGGYLSAASETIQSRRLPSLQLDNCSVTFPISKPPPSSGDGCYCDWSSQTMDLDERSSQLANNDAPPMDSRKRPAVQPTGTCSNWPSSPHPAPLSTPLNALASQRRRPCDEKVAKINDDAPATASHCSGSMSQQTYPRDPSVQVSPPPPTTLLGHSCILDSRPEVVLSSAGIAGDAAAEDDKPPSHLSSPRTPTQAADLIAQVAAREEEQRETSALKVRNGQANYSAGDQSGRRCCSTLAARHEPTSGKCQLAATLSPTSALACHNHHHRNHQHQHQNQHPPRKQQQNGPTGAAAGIARVPASKSFDTLACQTLTLGAGGAARPLEQAACAKSEQRVASPAAIGKPVGWQTKLVTRGKNGKSAAACAAGGTDSGGAGGGSSSSVKEYPFALHSNVNTGNMQSVIKMLVSVVVMFFICWAPFHAQRLMAIYVTEPTSEQEFIYSLLNHISGVSYYISAVVNPILYSLFSVKFRQAFRDTFSSLRLCSHANHPEFSVSRA